MRMARPLGIREFRSANSGATVGGRDARDVITVRRVITIRVQSQKRIPSNPPLLKGGRGDFECELL